MSRIYDRKERRLKNKRRYRAAVRGTAERPRLAVFRSLRNIYTQLVDDDKGVTIVAASTLEGDLAGPLKSKSGREAGKRLGQAIAERAKEKGIAAVVFDRGGFTYHGVVRAVADAAREAGLSF